MSNTPLTDLREKHQRDYRAYYERHPEQTRKDQARQERYQEETRESAERHGETWDGTDEAESMDLSVSLSDAAVRVGRTYAAVRQGRHRRVRRYGLSNSLIKTEHDEYMALMRRKDFTLEDVMNHKQRWAQKREAYLAGDSE